jgi:hypothetical protein
VAAKADNLQECTAEELYKRTGSILERVSDSSEHDVDEALGPETICMVQIVASLTAIRSFTMSKQ